jgi:hypothetical protein
MEEERKKSKRLSYTAKFKPELIQCAEEKENAKPLHFLELMKTMLDCGRNTRRRSAGVRRYEEIQWTQERTIS